MNSTALLILPRELMPQSEQEVEGLIGQSLEGSPLPPCLSCSQHLATVNVEGEASFV